MSGPKVVNIEAVRRRQKRESLIHLRKLQLVLTECERLQSQSQSSLLLNRLHALRDAEQWEPLSMESAKLSNFYEEEAHRLRQQHAAEQTATLRRSHRLRQSIAQMTAYLQSQPAGPERDRLIGQLSSVDVTTQQTALNEALHAIEQNQRNETTSRLREFAAALTDSIADRSHPALPKAPVDPYEQRLDRSWNLLGELSALEESPQLQSLTKKARHIAAAPVDQQALLLDSLVLELSSHLQNRRAALALRNELELLLAELEEVHSSESADWKDRITASFAQPHRLETVQKLVQEARTWIEEAFANETRLEQRAAVLRALASTGYEVREGMAAAWVEEGRIIIRKPTDSAYGVELSASAQGSAVQTRVVALTDAQRDSQRDREVEETWCEEFGEARSLLLAAGFKASLVEAHPAGSIPLKTAATSSSGRNEHHRLELGNAAQRKLKG